MWKVTRLPFSRGESSAQFPGDLTHQLLSAGAESYTKITIFFYGAQTHLWALGACSLFEYGLWRAEEKIRNMLLSSRLDVLAH